MNNDTYELSFTTDHMQKTLRIHTVNSSARILHKLAHNHLGKTVDAAFPTHQVTMYYDIFQRMKTSSAPCHFTHELANGSLWDVEVTYKDYLLSFQGKKQSCTLVPFTTNRSMNISYGIHQGAMILTKAGSKYIVENMDSALQPFFAFRNGDTLDGYLEHSRHMRSYFFLDICLQRNGHSYLLDSYDDGKRCSYYLFFLYPLHSDKEQLIMNIHRLSVEQYYEMAARHSHVFRSNFRAPGCCRDSIRSIIEEVQLTPREKEILYLLMQGLPYKTIAAQLIIAEGTVKKIASNIYHKYNVSSRSELVHLLYQQSDTILMCR